MSKAKSPITKSYANNANFLVALIAVSSAGFDSFDIKGFQEAELIEITVGCDTRSIA